MPVFEGAPYWDSALYSGVCPVFIAPPNASPETLQKVAEFSEGYTYVVSRFGVTGAERGIGVRSEVVGALRVYGAPPAVIGFGISTPGQVRRASGMGAAGAISGSAMVALIGEAAGDGAAAEAALTGFVRSMKSATAAPGRGRDEEVD